MASPFARVELSGSTRDFQCEADPSGVPLLDKSYANSRLLSKWMGRFVADVKWDGQTVAFYVQNDEGGLPGITDCRPATAADLRRRLRKDRDAIQEKLRSVTPRTPHETTFHQTVTWKLKEQLERSGVEDPSSTFFKYKDQRGRRCLVWAWGYRSVPSKRAATVICPNAECRLLARITPGTTQNCARCGHPLVRRRSRKRAALVLLLLAAMLGVGVWALRPYLPGLAEQVAQRVVEKPAAVAPASTGEGQATVDHAPTTIVEAPTQEEPAPPPAQVVPAEVAVEPAVQLAVVSGQVVDAVSQSPVPGAKVAVGDGTANAETDQDGRFTIEAVRSGPAAIEVAAPGYQSRRIEQELKPAEETDVRVELEGNITLAGEVVDAESKQPIPEALVTSSPPARSVKTDAQGRFHLEGLSPLEVDLHVSADGYAVADRIEHLAAPNDDIVAGTPPVPLAAAIRVELPPLKPIAAVPPPPPAVARTPKEEEPAVSFFGIKAKARSVGFVVDCSGSMEGSRLARTKAELAESIFALRPQQEFYVSFFNDVPIPMSDPPRTPVPATPIAKVRMFRWLSGITSDGGTNPEPSIQMVGDMKPGAIFLLSDGEFSPLGDQTFQLLKSGNIAVHTVAFEDDAGAQLLSDIAKQTGGTYRFVPAEELPPHMELRLESRLADLLIDALDDPPPSDNQQLRQALGELCDGQDFGPLAGAGPAEIKRSADKWTDWWVEHRLLPVLREISQESLARELRDPLALWRLTALQAAQQQRLDVPGEYVTALADSDVRVQQAARAGLIALSGEDYGPEPQASQVEHARSIARWTDWLKRRRSVEDLATADPGALAAAVHDPDPATRRAALEAIRTRKLPLWDPLFDALTDSSPECRQLARQALNQLSGGQDFGPLPGAGNADWAATARKWKDWRAAELDRERARQIEAAEQKARNLLDMANRLLRKQRAEGTLNDPEARDLLRKRYQAIIDQFSGTPSAAEAQRQLAALR